MSAPPSPGKPPQKIQYNIKQKKRQFCGDQTNKKTALRRILATAPAAGHAIQVCAVQGRMAGLMALCVSCGACGSECVRLLRAPCAGQAGHRGFSIRAVAAGRHPVCRASVVERVWAALGPLAVAPPGAAPAGASAPPAVPPLPAVPPAPGEPAAPPPRGLGPAEDDADEWSLAELLAWHGDPPEG